MRQFNRELTQLNANGFSVKSGILPVSGMKHGSPNWSSDRSYDAVIVGSGPNGLCAAIRLAQARLKVVVLEANETFGGGTRSAELTLPGFLHDVCSAVHPLAVGSPFLRRLELEKLGLEWRQPEVPLAHPLGGSEAAVLQRSVESTAANLGRDKFAYARLMAPLVRHWENLSAEFLQPLLHWPAHPIQLSRFACSAFRSSTGLATRRFKGEPARALIAGLAGHSFLPLDQVPSAAYAVVLGLMGHAVGWPLPRGGSQQIANALVSSLRSLGGEIQGGQRIDRFDQLPRSRVVLLDVTPRQLLSMAGDALPQAYRRKLQQFRYGPGVFKIDYALSGPIPWTAAACRRAGTVHVGGTILDIARAEAQVAEGRHPDQPFVLLAQPSLFDPSRAPEGKHTAWAYCHVPAGSGVDMTARIENQIERFAPGFRDLVLARRTANCAELERENANLVEGSISGGAANLWQLLARPVLSLNPYRTPLPGLYLCSSSTPPGPGVHGMCGFNAAELAIRDHFS